MQFRVEQNVMAQNRFDLWDVLINEPTCLIADHERSQQPDSGCSIPGLRHRDIRKSIWAQGNSLSVSTRNGFDTISGTVCYKLRRFAGRDLNVFVIMLWDAQSVLIFIMIEIWVCNRIGNDPNVVVHSFPDMKFSCLRQEYPSDL